MSIHMMVCLCHLKTKSHFGRNNIVLNVKFQFAGELRGFAHCVCFFLFVCRVLRFRTQIILNTEKHSLFIFCYIEG